MSDDLRARADYYERRTDDAARYLIRADEQLSLTQRALTQKTLAFTILARLRDTVAVDPGASIGAVFERTLALIHDILKVDRSMIFLERSDHPGVFEVAHHLGLHPDVVERLPALYFNLGPEQFDDARHVIANRAAGQTPLVGLLRHMLGIRYFILVPLLSGGVVFGYLLSSNDKEAYPFYPPFDEGQLDTYSAIAGFIAAAYTNSRLVGDLTAAKEELEAYSSKLEQMVAERTADLDQKARQLLEEKEKSEELLLNILPRETAMELRATGQALARSFDQVTVVFADIVGFSRTSKDLEAQGLVAQLDQIFRAFDHIVARHNLEKLKTIGDAYMCAGGIPVPNESHAVDAIRACLDAQRYLIDKRDEDVKAGRPPFSMRFGIHTGPVVAGVVGSRKFAYDIWGDSVNTAAAMESFGQPGRINISRATYELVKDHFACVARGMVEVKHGLEVEMFFVEREIEQPA